MFAYIKGLLAEVTENAAVIDINGVGFSLAVTSRFAQSHHKGEQVTLHSQMIVREDDISLFGFETKQEKAMFLRLTAVSGIGPKVALGVLSAMDVSQIASALVTSDAKAFSRVPNIGPKTANRIILELKDKVDVAELIGADAAAVGAVMSDAASEAIAALIGLGYQRTEAAQAVAAVRELADTAEEMTLLALRRINS